MTEMGKELEEAMREDEWTVSDHTITHKASRIELWKANDYPFFRLYRAGSIYDENKLVKMLNRFDRCVVWRAYEKRLWKYAEEARASQVNEVLNTLRLGRIKETGGKL
jgi:hypothetical protein